VNEKMRQATKDTVLKIPGAHELLHKTDEIFLDRAKKIVFIENGFQIYSEGLPYYFQVCYYEEIGWNVFLTPLGDSLDDHEETDILYHQLEDTVDIVNMEYFDVGDIEKAHISYHFFKLKSFAEEKAKNIKQIDKIKDTGKYVLKVFFNHPRNVTLELGYSPIFKRWYYEFIQPDKKDNIINHHSTRNYLEEIDYMISHLNHST
jgi:hypothetical protein